MKSSLIAMAVCAATLLGAAAPAAAQDMRVRVYNRSSETVFHIYSSPSWKSRYGNQDLLGSRWLEPGESTVINFNSRDGEGECQLDIKAEGAGSIKWTKRSFDVCRQDSWYLND